MKPRQTAARDFGQGAAEETLAPGESVILKKSGGKVFELRRVDTRAKSMNTGLDRLLAEMPPEGERVRTNLSRIIIEGRE